MASFVRMSWIYRRLLRPLLFLQDSESIHDRTLRLLSYASRSRWLCRAISLSTRVADFPVHCFGLRFPNPLGLAAEIDKHTAAMPVWRALGFGFSEVGGVTWLAQPGNPKPRMYRAV